MTTQKVFSSRANALDSTTYIGEVGRLFYAQPAITGQGPSLRYSDGVTPGGLQIIAPLGTIASTSTFGAVKVDGITIVIDSNGIISAVAQADDDSSYATISYVTNQGYLTSSTVNTYITPSDRISSGTSQLVVTADNTVTFPTLTTMSDSTASVVFNMADAVIGGLLDYSTTSTDTLGIGVYGNADAITAPWAVTEFTVAPDITLQVGDIVSGAGYPVPSYIIFVGTGGFSSIVITSTDFSNDTPAALPQAGQTVTIARPTETLAFDIRSPNNTSILINPGNSGNIIMNHDLIPLQDNVQSLGSVLNRWRHLWVSGGSIFIKDLTQDTDVGLTARDGLLTVLGSAGLKVGEFTLQDNQITIKSNDRDIIIGSTTATGYVQFNRPVKMVDSLNNKVFEITRDGLVTILPKQNISITESAFSIIGNAAGVQQPRNFTGTMLQITGQNGVSSRVSIDSFGTNAYPLIAGRAARGTVQTPTALKANDILFRISTQGYGDNQYVQTIGRISIEAAEDFANTTAGTRINFQLTPTGTNVIQTSTLIINSRGIDFDGNATGGITFYDRTRQTTAFTGTIAAGSVTGLGTAAVTSISIGTGLSGSGGPGVASLNNTGVISVAGTANQVYVNDATTATSGDIILTLPQDIDPTSNVTFNDVTINGTLNFLSSATILIPSTVEGTILYLGFTATTTSTIDGGGIQLGNTSTGIRSIFWRRNGNYWDFDGSGITVKDLNATTSTLDTLIVTNSAHFGNSNIVGDYPTAEIQIDSKLDGYSQVVFQNHSSSTYASTDFVATNNIGDDSHHFINMGINGSNYSTSTWTVNGANDGYLYIDGGNLALGTTATNVKFFTGGTLAANVRATIDATGLRVVSTVTSAGFYGPLTGAVTGDVTGNVSGNAGSVTNGLYSNQTYNNPSWLATLAGSKITGAVALATTVTNGVYTTDVGSVSNTMLAGGITNSKLSSSTITLNVSNGITVSQASPSLGGSTTIGFNTATLIATAVTATSAAVAYSLVGGIGVASLAGSSGTSVSGSTGAVTVWFNTATLVLQAVSAQSATTSTSAAVAYSTVAAHTAGTGLSGSTFNGSTAVTWTLNTATLMATAVLATTAGTVTTAAQPAITSVGTLTSLTVTNLVTANTYAGQARNAGTLGAGGTLTIDFATDHNVLVTLTTTAVIAFSNITAGKTVTVLVKNATGNNRVVTTGVLDGNTSGGNATPNVNDQRTGVFVYRTFGTATTDIYCEVNP